MGNCATHPDFGYGWWETTNIRGEQTRRKYHDENEYFGRIRNYNIIYRAGGDYDECCEGCGCFVQKMQKDINDDGIIISTKDYNCCCPCRGQDINWKKSTAVIMSEAQHVITMEKQKESLEEERKKQLEKFKQESLFKS